MGIDCPHELLIAEPRVNRKGNHLSCRMGTAVSSSSSYHRDIILGSCSHSILEAALNRG
jgi:hypothetical protein